MDSEVQRPTWTRFSDASKADILALEEDSLATATALPDLLLGYFRHLADVHPCPLLAVSPASHCLQSATRAHHDGRDEEYVVCALLHDIGDHFAPLNHGDFAAAILKPYVSERNHWMVQHHPVFQGHYFFEHLGLDPDARDRYRDHPHYEHSVEFCELYDQVAFDASYESHDIEFFAPMVRRILAPPTSEAGPLSLQDVMTDA